MRINQNLSALNAYRNLVNTDTSLNRNLERLSSGFRINRAADDAAGLAISEKMRGQIRGLNQAISNAQDGISMIQTAEGALTETHNILQRMRELAVQASNDTLTDEDRGEIQNEVNQLAEELSRIARDTEFNTQGLLNGELSVKFHIGANEGQNISLVVGDMSAEALNVAENVELTESEDQNIGELFDLEDNAAIKANVLKLDDEIVAAEVDGKFYRIEDLEIEVGGTEQDPTYTLKAKEDATPLEQEDGKYYLYSAIDVSSQENADKAITTINDAIEIVSAERSKLGAYQNRLEHTIANLGVSAENLTDAESRIRDVDMAAEVMQFTKNQILMQAGTAMLAQANIKPQSVLQLLA